MQSLPIDANIYIYSWTHEICSDDNEERALVVGTMNELAYVFQAWLPNVVWQQVDAPEYRKGFITVTILSVILIITTFAICGFEKWEKAEKQLQDDSRVDVNRADSDDAGESEGSNSPSFVAGVDVKAPRTY